MLATMHDRYVANKEHFSDLNRARYLANREDLLARQAEYNKAHKDGCLARSRAHYRANKETYRIQSRAWKEANRDVVKALELGRRKALKVRLVEWLGGVCEWCGSSEWLEFDHIVALQITGEEREGNLIQARHLLDGATGELGKIQLLCRPCHQHKSRIDNGWMRWAVKMAHRQLTTPAIYA